MEVWPGSPFPLGPTWDGEGTNFSLFSENAVKPSCASGCENIISHSSISSFTMSSQLRRRLPATAWRVARIAVGEALQMRCAIFVHSSISCSRLTIFVMRPIS